MGKIIALRSTDVEIYASARNTAWKSLTKVERVYVRVVERDKALSQLFDALERDYRETGWFAVPAGYSRFEETALHTMHRFVDELAYLMAELTEVKILVDEYNLSSHQMPV